MHCTENKVFTCSDSGENSKLFHDCFVRAFQDDVNGHVTAAVQKQKENKLQADDFISNSLNKAEKFIEIRYYCRCKQTWTWRLLNSLDHWFEYHPEVTVVDR